MRDLFSLYAASLLVSRCTSRGKGLFNTLLNFFSQLIQLILQLLGSGRATIPTPGNPVPTTDPNAQPTTDPNVGMPTTDPNAQPTTDPNAGGGTIAPQTSSAPSAQVAKYKIDLTSDLKTLKVPGLSAAIVKNGKVVCTAVAGMADTSQNKPVTPDTAFLWASVSKTVTATALMQLFDQGKFKLDDDISKFIGFPVQIPSCPGTPVTFRQLLTHSSSIVDNDTVIDSVMTPQGDPTVPLADLVKGYLTLGGKYYNSTNFASGCPGTSNSYSNMGATIIGYLVQVMSGTDFYHYTKAHIFTPLGMTNTSFRLADMDQSLIALPKGNGPHYGEGDFPDGMVRTSPSQLGKFLAAYMQGGQYNGQQILKSTTVQEMLKNQTSLDSTQGLIWYSDSSFSGSTAWGHNGSDTGAASNMFFDPATRIGVLLVANGTWKGDAPATMRKLFQEGASY
jgi:CubicO group peptidase (beta-lactamase class C family)